MCKLSAAAQPPDSSSLANYALVMKLADITWVSNNVWTSTGKSSWVSLVTLYMFTADKTLCCERATRSEQMCTVCLDGSPWTTSPGSMSSEVHRVAGHLMNYEHLHSIRCHDFCSTAWFQRRWWSQASTAKAESAALLRLSELYVWKLFVKIEIWWIILKPGGIVRKHANTTICTWQLWSQSLLQQIHA